MSEILKPKTRKTYLEWARKRIKRIADDEIFEAKVYFPATRELLITLHKELENMKSILRLIVKAMEAKE